MATSLYTLADKALHDGVLAETFAPSEHLACPWGPHKQHGGPVAGPPGPRHRPMRATAAVSHAARIPRATSRRPSGVGGVLAEGGLIVDSPARSELRHKPTCELTADRCDGVDQG